MKEEIQVALTNHCKGYNCAQAVACAFADKVGMDEETLFRITEGFGAGMGNLSNTCGAVTGAIAVASLKSSTGNLKKPNSKGKTYQISKRIVEEFENKNGTVVCKELKGLETGNILRTCDGCIHDAAEIIYEILNEDELGGFA